MTHFIEHIENTLRNAWTRPILSDFHTRDLSGADIAKGIVSLHCLFRRAGLEEETRMAIYGANSANWAISFLSVNTYHAVAVPLLSDFRPEDATTLVRHSSASVLFVQKSTWNLMLLEHMPSLRIVISLDDFSILWSATGDSGSLENAISAESVDDLSPDKVHFIPQEDDDLVVINYTSGTTSAPKGVMLTVGNFDANVEFALENIPIHGGERIVSMLPMAHMYGFMFEFIYPMSGGAHVYFLGKTPSPALLLGALKEVRPYLLITVPLVMEKIFKNSVRPVVSKKSMKVLLSIPGISQIILGKIRGKLMDAFGGEVREVIMGGAALNPDVEHWLRRIGLPYTIGYGMTEAAPLLAYEWWERFVPNSCGKAIAGCEVRIESEDPQHVAGEIQARGKNIMKGYFNNPEATAMAFTDDGWLRTGDLGVIDADGNIFIRGRSKNMILSSNGQNIYPEEIEAVINSLPDVVESVVVSRNGRLTALVYTGENGPVLSKEALQKINSRLPAYSRVADIEMVLKPFEKTPKQSIRRFLYK